MQYLYNTLTNRAQAEYDYFPFGSVMQGRAWNNEKYRFGFNGKEEDTEGMGGGGSTYDYGF